MSQHPKHSSTCSGRIYLLPHQTEENVLLYLLLARGLLPLRKFFLLFPTSYTSYFMLLNIIVLVTTTLSICPYLLSVTHQSAFVFFYFTHILNGLSLILLETKVKIRIKYSIHSSTMNWKTWKTKRYLTSSRKVPEDYNLNSIFPFLPISF